MMQDEYQIDSDGITVWVNHIAGYCAARYGRAGVEIFNSPDAYDKTGRMTLFRSAGEPTSDDWEIFREEMVSRFGFVMPQKHKPHRFRTKNQY